MNRVNVVLNCYNCIIHNVIAWYFAILIVEFNYTIITRRVDNFFNNHNCEYNTTEFMSTLTSQFTIVCDTK